MLRIFIVLTNTICGSVAWSDVAVRSITLKSDSRSFQIYEANGSYYSTSCLTMNCTAKKIKIPKAVAKQIQSEHAVTNPGDKVCSLIGGIPFVGRFENRNEQTFCYFKDQSLVDCSTLHALALE